MLVFRTLVSINLLGLKRDRVLWSLIGVALLSLALVPLISLFSMRQLQELAVSLSLSGTSLFLLVSTLFLGSTAVWRDLEKRHAVTVLTLPMSRGQFVLAKFAALALFLLLSTVVLGVIGGGNAMFAVWQYPPDQPIVWVNYIVALGMLGFKYLLLLSIIMTFSMLSTSFFLPVFGSLAFFMAGSACFQVLEYVMQHQEDYGPVFVHVIKGFNYLLPNFSAFDFEVYAVYGLPLPWRDIAFAFGYGVLYTSLILWLAIVLFQRREL